MIKNGRIDFMNMKRFRISLYVKRTPAHNTDWYYKRLAGCHYVKITIIGIVFILSIPCKFQSYM
jgi:hypothetical protein